MKALRLSIGFVVALAAIGSLPSLVYAQDTAAAEIQVEAADANQEAADADQGDTIKLNPEDAGEVNELMDAEAYTEFVAAEEH